MSYDNRYDAADYYDRFSSPPGDDVSFYLGRLPDADARVLELGCGTGRVMLPVAERAGFVLGVDESPAMLAVCDQKLKDAGLPTKRARTLCADITTLDLGDEQPGFDRIIAPFRVLQNLEADEQVDGLMRVIKRHLKPGGEAVLNTFRPRGGYKELAAFWSARDDSKPTWTKPMGEYTVAYSEDCTVYKNHPPRVYPKLIYRRLNASGKLVDESVLDIVMRVWRADELTELVERHGFSITQRLGGYEGQAWGEGPELIVAFTHG